MSRIGRSTLIAIGVALCTLLVACQRQEALVAPTKPSIRVSGTGTAVALVRILVSEYREEDVDVRKHFLGASLEITAAAGVLSYEPQMIEAVASTPGAIGYFSLGSAIAQGGGTRVVDLDGVKPTIQSVHVGKCPTVRTLGVVTRSRAPEPVARFIRWAAGSEGRAVMERHGYAAAS